MEESAPTPNATKPRRRGLRLLNRWLVGAYEDNATGLAAQLSYDFLFLLAPGPLLVSALLSIFGTDPATLANIIALLKGFLPEIAHPIIDRQIAAIVVSGFTTKFAFVGIALALYLGLNFINTFTRSLNHTLGIKEMQRPWWSRSLLALLLLFILLWPSPPGAWLPAASPRRSSPSSPPTRSRCRSARFRNVPRIAPQPASRHRGYPRPWSPSHLFGLFDNPVDGRAFLAGRAFAEGFEHLIQAFRQLLRFFFHVY